MVFVVIPTIKQRIQIVGEERALSETEAWIDGLVAENKKLKFQQDQLRLVLGSGEPLHVDYDTLLELAQLFKQDLAEARAVKKFLFEENERLKAELAARGEPESKTYTFRVYGEDVSVKAKPDSSIHDVFTLLLNVIHPAGGNKFDRWEFYTLDGRRLMPFFTLRGTNTDMIVATLPIEHGG